MAEGVRSAVRDSLPLSVDVSELLRRPGATKRIQGLRPLVEIALPLARVPKGAEAELDVRLDALVDGIHASGHVQTVVELECRRCLSSYRHEIDVSVDAVFLPRGEGDDDTYLVEGDEVDLEPAIRDAVGLSLPLNPLCKPGCKGLCTVCGADRNLMECGHEQQNADIRWSALEDLRRKMEE